MTTKEMITKVFERYGVCSAKQISMFIKREFKKDVSPSSVSGNLRTLVNAGLVGRSNYGAGTTMYWLANKEAI